MRRAARLRAIGSACVCFAAAACGGDGSAPAGPEGTDPGESAVASIEMRPHQLYMDSLGFAVQTHAIAYDGDGRRLYSSAERPERFSWASSAGHVASVDETGSVTSESWGTATVTATHAGGVAGASRVRVRDAVDLAWSLPVGTGSILAGVAIGADGTIYVGTSDHPAHRSLWYAVSPQGSVLWTLDLPLTGFSTPAIGADGTLYLGSWSADTTGRLIAVAPGGTVRWILHDIDPIYSTPALGPDGTVYVVGRHHVYAIDPEGEIEWAYETAAEPFGVASPAIASDGTIYVGGYDRQLHAITPDGSLRWTFGAEDVVVSSPAIGPDGTVYFGSHDGRLHAVRPDGTARWSLTLDREGVDSSPSIGADGTVYVVAGSLFAIDPAGSIRWTHPAGSHGSQPTVLAGADGTVYFGSFRGMAALDARGNLLWTHPLPPGWTVRGSPAIGHDGKVLMTSFSASEAAVHALVGNGSTNGGFAGAAWPTARGDRANSGRAGG